MSDDRFYRGAGAEPRSLLEIARGSVRGHQAFRLVGLNKAVTATETVWPLGGLYAFPTVVQQLRVRAGGDPLDTAAGSGAREIRVRGLDASFAHVSETLALAGASASASTSAGFARLNDVIVTQAGSYGGSNVGNVFVEGAADSTTFGGIEANAGISRVGVATVPAGWTAYIVGGSISVDGSATVEGWERRRADAGTAPFGPARNILRRAGVSGMNPVQLAAYVEVPEKADLWFTASASIAAEVHVDLEIILVNSAALDSA